MKKIKEILLKLQDKFEWWLIKDISIDFLKEWNDDYF
jgi:hypothetical protein